MLAGSRVVVVVPAFMEEERIARVIETLPAFVDASIVIDDASSDRTAARAAAAGAIVISHEKNRGVGAAIATGYRRALAIAHAPNDVICVMAGDAQMDPRDLESVALPVARGEADYVKGNRFAWPDRARPMPIARRVVGRALSAMTSVAIGQRIYDSQCGYTAISAGACGRLDLDAIYPRYGYPNDLLARVASQGMTIVHVPVRAVFAGESSGLRPWHVPTIAGIVGRAYLSRMRDLRGMRGRSRTYSVLA